MKVIVLILTLVMMVLDTRAITMDIQIKTLPLINGSTSAKPKPSLNKKAKAILTV